MKDKNTAKMHAALESALPGLALPSENSLIDSFGRRVSYVRISVTDRCDFRCIYCMSENMQFAPRSEILTLEEILQLCRAFTELGVDKIRITGGEPLVRRNLLWLLERVARLPSLRELVLTTNASQLAKLAAPIRDAGVSRINISLDSLQSPRFRAITRVGDLRKVLQGIDAALEAGFERVKINSVILRHRNHDEVVPLLRFAMAKGTDISYIEEMPLGDVQGHDRAASFYSSDEVLHDLAQHVEVVPTTEHTGGPARYYRISGSTTRIGLISPHSHNFCHNCNRVRLTAQGRLLLCLGQEHSVDLRAVLRSNKSSLCEIKQAIRQSMSIKPKGHDFNHGVQTVILRHMNVTGG
jgi:cyclic pyranopterin phosphate synthase